MVRVGRARDRGPRAAGGNEARRTFVLCCASSWFTSTRRLNVVCFGAGCVAGEGSGACGRACHGVSRMAHALQSGEIHAAGSRGRGENEDRTLNATSSGLCKGGTRRTDARRLPGSSRVGGCSRRRRRRASGSCARTRVSVRSVRGRPSLWREQKKEETFSKLFRSRTPTPE